MDSWGKFQYSRGQRRRRTPDDGLSALIFIAVFVVAAVVAFIVWAITAASR